MSNQLQITGGAKVRNLEGVLTGTTGVVSSLPINAANGIPQLDVNGKILVDQLPNSIMEYKGTWDASTNTPTLANGTGNQGDVYLCNVAGTVNFGAGPIAFIVGDSAVYSGSIWQRSGGATGTVTSVGLSTNAGAITIGNSPISTSGTITANFNGTNLQYVNGAGNLTTFPTLMTSVGLTMPSAFTVTNSPLTGAGGTLAVTGAGTTAQYIRGDGSLATFPTIATEAQRLITEVYNETGATLTKGTVVYINGGHGNLPTVTKAIATGDATSAQTYGIVQTDITNMNNGNVVVIGSLMDLDTQAYAAGTQLYLSSTTAGAWTSVKQYAPAHLVYVGIVVRSHPTQGVVEVRIQNGFEMDELHNVSAQTPSNNQGLFYNTSTSLWENKSIATALGYTPADDSLVVHLAGTETITGAKTFTGAATFTGSATFNNTLGNSIILNYGAALVKGNTPSSTSGVWSNIYAAAGNNNLVIADDVNISKLQFQAASTYTYTFPAATGTIALTSDLGAYLPLAGGTMTGAIVGTTSTFTNAGSGIGVGITLSGASGDGLKITHSAGRALNIASSGAGYGIIINNDTGSTSAPFTIQKQGSNVITMSDTGAANFTGQLTLGSTITNGSSTYTLPSATGTLALTSALSGYLPLAGGTLTGALGGTSASFSSTGRFIGALTIGTDFAQLLPISASNYQLLVGSYYDGTNIIATATSGSRTVYNIGGMDFRTFTGATVGSSVTDTSRFTIASTGAATFSSSVTAQLLAISNGYYLVGRNAANTAFRTLLTFDSSNKIIIGQDSDITAVTLGVGSEAMRITSGGNVLIGTSSPLQTAANRTVLTINGTTSNVLNFGVGGTLSGYIYNDAYTTGLYAQGDLYLQADGAKFTAFVNNSVERMRITSGGNVLIGTTTDSGQKLQVNGTILAGGSIKIPSTSYFIGNATYGYRFNNGADSATLMTILDSGAATFSSSVTATGFFESSDSRLKTLIQDNYQTNGIASITPKLYTKNGKVELGYYAQDFVGILDSAVSKGSDDMLSLSYREVHTAKIYALEQEIKELKAKMN